MDMVVTITATIFRESSLRERILVDLVFDMVLTPFPRFQSASGSWSSQTPPASGSPKQPSPGRSCNPAGRNCRCRCPGWWKRRWGRRRRTYGGVQHLHGGGHGDDELDEDDETDVGQGDVPDPLPSGAAVQCGGLHDVRGDPLNGGQVQQHRHATADDAGEDNAEFHQIRIAEPCLGLTAEEFDHLIGDAVVGMPDPPPDDDIDGGGDQCGQQVHGGDQVLTPQLVEEQGLDHRDEEHHQRCKNRNTKLFFHASQ